MYTDTMPPSAEEESTLEVTSTLSRSPKKKTVQRTEKVAVIGGGWFGCHTAKYLADLGYEVHLFEKEDDIFMCVSGKFGVRIHAGPHYPRSLATRNGCHNGFNEFIVTYPDFVNEHERSIYAIGKLDYDGNPSKVSAKDLRDVCDEFQSRSEIHVGANGYTDEVEAAFDMYEPSAVIGTQLRTLFRKYLQESGVIIKYNTRVTNVRKEEFDFKTSVYSIDKTSTEAVQEFDHVINTTGYQSLTLSLELLPFNIKVFYQPCLALVYEDLQPGEKPMSFIVMDGWFPCLMPYDDRPEKTSVASTHYIVTHGKLTIVGSYKNVDEANRAFSKITADFVNDNIRNQCEEAMAKFWPEFSKRFKYLGFKGEVLAKIQTEGEFRGSIVFQETINNMIYVFPGKITNIFESAREVLALMKGRDYKTTPEGLRYIKPGGLYYAKKEFSNPIQKPNTCNLQTFTKVLEDPLGNQETKSDQNKPVSTGSLNSSLGNQLVKKCDDRLFPATPQNSIVIRNVVILFCLCISARLINPVIQDKKGKDLTILTASLVMAFLTYSRWSKLQNTVGYITYKLSKIGIFTHPPCPQSSHQHTKGFKK